VLSPGDRGAADPGPNAAASGSRPSCSVGTTGIASASRVVPP